MTDNSIYKRNLELFLKNCPKFAEVFETLKPSFWNICETGPFKIRNLKRTVQGKDYFIYNPENPLAEAEQWLNTIDLAVAEVVVVYGVGLGYYYKVAKEWLRNRPFRLLIFVEDDLFLLRTFLELEEAAELLEDPQVLLFPIHARFSSDMDFYTVIKKILLKKVNITALRDYALRRSESYMLIQFKFEFYKHWLEIQNLEYLDYGRTFYSQFFRNIFSFPSSYLVSEMKDYFKNIPAVVCGAGPSLQKQFEHLKDLGGKALIFGGGSALNALNANNLQPHFGVSVDPFPAQFTRLIMNTAYEMPFIYTMRVNVEAFGAVHGPRLYVCNSGGYTVGSWLERKMGISTNQIDTGANVVNFSVSLAKYLGCNPIILIGQDLAYTGGASYAPGIESHAIHRQKSTITTKSETEELIIHKDIYGKDTLTLWKWIAESYWFTMFAKENPTIKLINSTEGGIGFQNVPNIAFEEVIKTYCTRNIDIHSLIHAATQRNPPPAKVTQESLVEILDHLQVNIIESLKLIDEKNVTDDLPEDLLATLDNQDAYQALVQELVKKLDIFIDIIKEASENKVNPSIEHPTRVFFISETFKHVMKYIKHALTTFAKEESVQKILLTFDFPPVEKEIYAIEGNYFIIEDSELGLSIHEELNTADLQWDSPQPWNGKLRLYDPGKDVILEQYYKDGQLHGPSTGYGEEGQILSRSWFVNGLCQGKANFYYFNGQLYAREIYRDNLKDGLQVYFYPDGNLKSVIPYSNDVLNGIVRLYYPSGIVQREIQFSQGKRDGIDGFILPTGQKLFVAHYKDNLPVGVTREWHENGALRLEITFDALGQVEKERRWSLQGGELDAEALAMDGFFEKLTKKIQTLTEAIETVQLQVIELIETLSNEPNYHPEMRVGFEQVKSELETLKSATATMMELTGLTGDVKKELIWKSPALRNALDQQVAFMSAKLRDAFNNMQSQVSALRNQLKNSSTHEPKR